MAWSCTRHRCSHNRDVTNVVFLSNPSGSCRTDPRSAAYHLPTSPAWRQGQRRASVPAVQDAAARDYPAQRSDTSSGWMTFVRRLSTVATCTQRRRASLCPLPRFPFHEGAGKGDECFTVSLRDNREAHDLFLLLFEQAIGRQASTPEPRRHSRCIT